MIIRQTLNFTAHLAAGVAFGALAVVALAACARAACARPRVREDVEPPRQADPHAT